MYYLLRIKEAISEVEDEGCFESSQPVPSSEDPSEGPLWRFKLGLPGHVSVN